MDAWDRRKEFVLFSRSLFKACIACRYSQIFHGRQFHSWSNITRYLNETYSKLILQRPSKDLVQTEPKVSSQCTFSPFLPWSRPIPFFRFPRTTKTEGCIPIVSFRRSSFARTLFFSPQSIIIPATDELRTVHTRMDISMGTNKHFSTSPIYVSFAPIFKSS